MLKLKSQKINSLEKLILKGILKVLIDFIQSCLFFSQKKSFKVEHFQFPFCAKLHERKTVVNALMLQFLSYSISFVH